MRAGAFHALAMALPGVTLDMKWGADRCYCVGGKMFAVAGREGEDEPRYCFKASDASFDLLTEEGVAEPAPYLARARWVLLRSADALPDDQLTAYLTQAHRLVAAKLTRKHRAALGLD
ncbi:MAG: MmcQ/YjbR family DNA-binding protein [Caulobacteraceae bacterium]|nr:MmcQ/YjbR family DNA-binding protein [Caulobacteraceae bacterium]